MAKTLSSTATQSTPGYFSWRYTNQTKTATVWAEPKSGLFHVCEPGRPGFVFATARLKEAEAKCDSMNA